ncbi:DUF126 domain-containing protein [Aquibium sp. LZ166]|uniref:DUF126 domain-containing protein n=1 Tax=Aquibium pacificus TaxID=3153579 RepID=A0ABV3SF92_9HYPH
MAARGEVLVAGAAGSGPALVLDQPISFWGGVDPKTGGIADVRHPQHGENVAGRVLFLPGTIGSSSASAVLLELVRGGRAPAAIVMHEPDAILLLGLIVAREMGWPAPVAVRLDRAQHAGFAGNIVAVEPDGTVASRASHVPGA